MPIEPQPGEVWFAELGMVEKSRPVLVLAYPEPADDQEPRLLSAHDRLDSRQDARWSIRGKEFQPSAPSVRKPGYNHEFFVCKAAPRLLMNI